MSNRASRHTFPPAHSAGPVAITIGVMVIVLMGGDYAIVVRLPSALVA